MNEPPSAELLGPRYRSVTISIFSVLSGLTLIAASCCNLVDVSGSGEEQIQLSAQVIVKLMVTAMAWGLAIWGVFSLPCARRALATPVAVALLALALVLMLASVVAIASVVNVSRFASLNFFLTIVFVTACLVQWGIDRVAQCVLIGSVVFLMGSWATYLLTPSIGVYVEHLGANLEYRRMGGLAHPNVLGRMAMLSAILALAVYRQLKRNRILLISIFLLAMATAAMAFSRTAILAGAVGLLVLFFDLIFTRRGAIACLTLAVLGLAGLLVVELVTGSDLLGRLFIATGTKTGHLEELTSATGRTAIWSESLRLIKLRPVTGYGLNSAPILLTDFSQHTHNIVLHPLLSGGILAGLLMSLVLLFNLLVGLRSADPLIRSVAAFVVVSGLFEDTVLGTFPGPPTIMWLVITLSPAIAWLPRSNVLVD